MTFQETVELLILEAQSRRLKPGTLKFYRARHDAIKEAFGERDLTQITHHDIRAVLATATSVEHTYRFLRQLFAFALNEEIIARNPMLKVTRPEYRSKVTQPLSSSDILTLFKACKLQRNPFHRLRDQTIFATLVGLGLRRMELCGLTDDDVRLADGFLRVVGKKDRERLVPIPSRLKLMLAKYQLERNKRWGDRRKSNHFFCNHFGGQLESHAVTNMMKRLGQKAGINLWTHKLRHTFATSYMANDGSDILTLQAICGWSTLAMAQRYAKPSMPRMQRSMETMSPVNQL